MRRRRGDHERAVVDATAALELVQDLSWARWARALSHVELGRWKAAEADLGAVIEREPEGPVAYRLRWYVRWKLGDRVGGTADYKKWKALGGGKQ